MSYQKIVNILNCFYVPGFIGGLLLAQYYGLLGLVIFTLVACSISLVQSVTMLVSRLIRQPYCPSCREPALTYTGCVSFGPRFYHCNVCGQDYQRAKPEGRLELSKQLN